MTTEKAATRARVLAARREMTPGARATAGAALTRFVLDLPEVQAARSAAAYISIGTEPPTADLVVALRSRGVRVLLPVLRDDLDLDWADYDGPGSIAQRSTRGLWEPSGSLLGVHAVSQVDVVVVPALSVDETGARLGRGGGSYDRALARVPANCPVVALLYDGELATALPSDPHDRQVTIVVTPSHVRRF